MAESKRNLRLQAEHHELIEVDVFHSLEEWCLHLMHLRAHREAAQYARNMEVLDLGCNLGYGSKILAESAKAVVGADVSVRAIETAKARYDGSNLTFRVMPDGTIPLENSTVDLVTSFQVLEHIEDVASFMAEILRVLKPGGQALFTTPNAEIRLDPGMRPWNPYHVREYTHVELAEELRNYFGSVIVRGLTAAESAYAVEYNRCQLAKAKAKSPLRSSFVTAVKNILPSVMLERIRERRRGMPLSVAELDEYSVEHFWYADTNLDSALDLMAVGSHPSPTLKP